MNTQQDNKRTNAKKLTLIGFGIGFCLFWLVIIVAAMPMSSGYSSNTLIIATRVSIQSIERAIETYKTMTGDYPKSVDDLIVPIGDKPPLLLGKGALVDSWGTPFRITFDGDTYEIRFAGPDRQMGTRDDITN